MYQTQIHSYIFEKKQQHLNELKIKVQFLEGNGKILEFIIYFRILNLFAYSSSFYFVPECVW